MSQEPVRRNLPRSLWSFATAMVTLAVGSVSVATAQVTNINVEIDYMVLRDAQGSILHSHEPGADVLAAAVQMFACHDITLTVDLDEELAEIEVLRDDPGDCSTFFEYTGLDSYGGIRQAHFGHDGQAGWHYCVFGHNYECPTSSACPTGCTRTTSSGIAETPGRYFLVSLGSFGGDTGTPFEQATTFVHELGHNLGLSHCGNPDCSQIGDDPVVLASVMSYAYQMVGVREGLVALGLTQAEANLFKNLDYSNGTMCQEDETALDEDRGTRMRRVDWNCDGTVGGVVAQDLEGVGLSGTWCGSAGPLGYVIDYPEWTRLDDVTMDRAAEERNVPRIVSCITYEEVQRLRQLLDVPQLTQIAPEDCVDGTNAFVDATCQGTWCIGYCDYYPARFLSTIVNSPGLFPDGSVVYMRGGSYVEPGTTLEIRRRLTITSTGQATIRMAGH